MAGQETANNRRETISEGIPGDSRTKIKLVGLMCTAFAILAALIILTQTFVLLVALVSTLSLAGYLLIDLRRQKKKPHGKNSRIKGPFPILFGLLVLPIAVAALYSLEEFNTRSIYSIVVAFGMTLTFMYSLINVPLTVYHKEFTSRLRPLYATPMITVIIPAYNEEKSIRKTLDSVIEADYPNKQVIVVDDGSTDNTLAIVHSYKSKFSPNSFVLISQHNRQVCSY
jgi:hypothetical protein